MVAACISVTVLPTCEPALWNAQQRRSENRVLSDVGIQGPGERNELSVIAMRLLSLIGFGLYGSPQILPSPLFSDAQSKENASERCTP